jgi:hypothetical protein
MILWAKLGGILGAIVAVFALGYHFGSLAPKLAEAKAEIKQTEAQDAKRVTDQATVAQEARSYEAAALEPIPTPVVRLCVSAPPAAMPGAHPAGPRADAPSAPRAADPVPPVPGPDIGPELLRAAHLADAEIAALQSYVSQVCQAKTP